MEPLQKITGLVKEFSGVCVLNNVDFDLYPGEIHALMGENGAGKSTLIKIISGAYTKTAGEVVFDGKPYDVRSTGEAIERGISTIYQELSLIPGMDIARNMALGHEPRMCKLGGLSKSIYSEATEKLKKVELDHLPPDTKVSELKIAYRQMIEICKAISNPQCKVLIMDEPTSSLSDDEIAQLFKLIQSLRAQGMGIIYISHKLNEIEELADRVTVLRDGCYIGTLGKEEINQDTILHMMVGQEIVRAEKHSFMTNEEVLRVEGMGDNKMVKSASFSLHKGEILGFFGLMGAGRTELMRMIFGVDKAATGAVFLHGKKVAFKSAEDAIKAGIGMVPEDRKEQGIFARMSNASNFAISSLKQFRKKGLLNMKNCKKTSGEMARKLKTKYVSEDQLICYLSGGNQQKCMLARWLIANIHVLILDEPTRGIDVAAKQDVYNIIKELAQQGIAVIMVSSEMSEVINLADRVVVMHEGDVMAYLQGDQINQDTIIRHAFGERDEASLAPAVNS